MKLSRLTRTAAAVTAAIVTLVAAPAALAVPIGTVYSFALDAQSKATLPGTNFGTVTLTQGQDKVDVKVTLADGFLFANTGVGAQFAFNLSSMFAKAAISLDAGTAAHFVVATPGSYNVTPYGVFADALLFKSGTPKGLSAQIGMPISFSVAQAGISLDAFTMSGARNGGQPGGYSFAADLGFAATGKTGGVGGIDHETITPPPPPPPPPPKEEPPSTDDNPPPPPPHELPEPVSVTLLGLGLGGLALARRRK